MFWRAVILILVLTTFVLSYNVPARPPAPVTEATSTEPIAVPTVTIAATSTTAFHETGTLVFYPNNVGPVPYLMYVDARGSIASKALVFDALPPTDFSSWTGARVDVTGTLVREHVLVRRIAYTSPP